MRLKIKAMSSEARASAAIIGALPFIMLAILSGVNPDYIGKLFTTSMGNMIACRRRLQHGTRRLHHAEDGSLRHLERDRNHARHIRRPPRLAHGILR